jgi:uncharacterized protein with von Willebrand factor type A (vWA) domain
MIDLVKALDHVAIGNRSDFYHTLRGLLVHRREHIPLFDRAFELFWRKHGDDWVGMELSELLPSRPRHTQKVRKPRPRQDDGDHPPPANGQEDEEEVVEIRQTYSEQEQLHQKDFGELSEEEIESVRRFMASLVWELGFRRTRRFRQGPSRHLDLRRVMRRNLRYGGEILELPTRRRKIKPRPMVIIADVSGSMEQYTRLLLSFIYSLAEGLTQHVEAFVFSTRLTRITKELHNRELDRALQQVSGQVPDWSGGTRIGSALKTFNFEWGRRVLGRGAVVMLISDGWDRGDPDLLQREIARLQRSCYRLIWLNPLLGSSRYEPLTRGMQAALPYVDDFLPVHNLASLEDLAQHLERLNERRPWSRLSLDLHGAAFVNPRRRR